MFLPLFHVRIRECRIKRAISQKQAAEFCGITAKRWSNLERGFRRPTTDEFQKISRYLKIGNSFPIPCRADRLLRAEGLRHGPKILPYFSPKDRLTHIRFKLSCRRYGRLTRILTERIRARDDFDACQYLCHQIASDSSLEILEILNRLVRGARPALVAPWSLGHTPHPIVDPSNWEQVGQRPQPCLIHNDTCDFYQVSFRAEHLKRVDVLGWRGRWEVIEINGRGHDSTLDHLRERDVGIPVFWKTEREILRECESSIRLEAS